MRFLTASAQLQTVPTKVVQAYLVRSSAIHCASRQAINRPTTNLLLSGQTFVGNADLRSLQHTHYVLLITHYFLFLTKMASYINASLNIRWHLDKRTGNILTKSEHAPEWTETEFSTNSVSSIKL